MNYVYVVHIWVGGDRIPVAAYQSRDRAEHCIEVELLGQLQSVGLSLQACDYFTVDLWQVGFILDRKTARSLTSYNARAEKERILVPYGEERILVPYGEERIFDAEDTKVPSRLGALLEDDLF